MTFTKNCVKKSNTQCYWNQAKSSGETLSQNYPDFPTEWPRHSTRFVPLKGFFETLFTPSILILFPSILCTCPNQHNLLNLIVSIIVGFLTHPKISLLVNILQFSFSLSYTGPKQKCSTAFYLSLLVSKFLIHMLTLCLLLCSLVSILVSLICFIFKKL